MAKVLFCIECDTAEAASLKRLFGEDSRALALSVARACRGFATGTKDGSVSLVPEAPPKKTATKSAPVKRARKAVEK